MIIYFCIFFFCLFEEIFYFYFFNAILLEDVKVDVLDFRCGKYAPAWCFRGLLVFLCSWLLFRVCVCVGKWTDLRPLRWGKGWWQRCHQLNVCMCLCMCAVINWASVPAEGTIFGPPARPAMPLGVPHPGEEGGVQHSWVPEFFFSFYEKTNALLHCWLCLCLSDSLVLFQSRMWHFIRVAQEPQCCMQSGIK